jgi:hypothetical protein
MDLNKTITDLRAERDKLEAVIKELEQLNGIRQEGLRIQSPRGRKSMGEAERRDVSERMRRYWASRREARRESCKS